jgi:pimeloyl-ACP methyl ester carboxylesterase
MNAVPVSLPTVLPYDEEAFRADVEFLEMQWKPISLAGGELPILDQGTGLPLVFVPILEHLEFVYARQLRQFSQSRRVILYRRRESRAGFISRDERAEELRQVLDALGIERADLLGHGDAAMVLCAFALRYPARCRSLTLVSQGPDYRIAPHPWIWLLHEVFLRLPVQRLVPASLIRRTVVRYITHAQPLTDSPTPSPLVALPAALITEQLLKIAQWPAVYRYSVLPVIHNFDVSKRVGELTMPVLLINRQDDILSPKVRTDWLAQHLPHCAGYHIIPARERFFLYSEAERVTPLIEDFLSTLQ